MKNKIKDNSGDRKYFIVTPRLVWLLARNPYDFSFWNTVKDIAGDEGECRITTKELAVLCMMSVGKVSECREYWISVGLLDGQREKEPNERNAIWHLSVPDFWEKNITESKTYKTIKSRIEFKKKQQIELGKTVSCGETVTVSPGEIGYTPHEIDYTPGETVYLYREEPNRRTKEESVLKDNTLTPQNCKNKKGKKYSFAETHMKAAKWFYESLKIVVPDLLPPKKFDAWADDFRKMMDIDRREKKKIVDLVEWLTTSEHRDAQFWIKNVQCPATLREKFAKISMAMEQAKKQNVTNGNGKPKESRQTGYEPRASFNSPQVLSDILKQAGFNAATV